MTIQFNKQLTHNAKLRSQVDDVRQERRTYDKIYKRLIQELENERSQINNLLMDARNSYDERSVSLSLSLCIYIYIYIIMYICID